MDPHHVRSKRAADDCSVRKANRGPAFSHSCSYTASTDDLRARDAADCGTGFHEESHKV
jgi:hypothetical protein